MIVMVMLQLVGTVKKIIAFIIILPLAFLSLLLILLIIPGAVLYQVFVIFRLMQLLLIKKHNSLTIQANQ
jgi:hypothetical protein